MPIRLPDAQMEWSRWGSWFFCVRRIPSPPPGLHHTSPTPFNLLAVTFNSMDRGSKGVTAPHKPVFGRSPTNVPLARVAASSSREYGRLSTLLHFTTNLTPRYRRWKQTDDISLLHDRTDNVRSIMYCSQETEKNKNLLNTIASSDVIHKQTNSAYFPHERQDIV